VAAAREVSGPHVAPLWRVPCADSHTYEVFYAYFAHWPDSRAYPGLAAVENAGSTECDARFARYDGVPRPAWLFTYTDVLPYPNDTCDSGSRQLVRIAFEPPPDHPNGAATRGSIKASFLPVTAGRYPASSAGPSRAIRHSRPPDAESRVRGMYPVAAHHL
jgi:hypothetical protein